jgi:hypothetical protein
MFEGQAPPDDLPVKRRERAQDRIA